MALLALFVFERGVCFLAIFFVVIVVQGKKVDEDVFDAVGRFGVKKIDGVMRSRQMAIHAVCDEPLSVVYVGGRFPGIVGKLNLVT
jgi:hypothetical protein